jgi:mRNA interferase YafQ
VRTPHYTRQFEKDVKRQKKRGKNPSFLKEILTLLIDEKELPIKIRDHRLIGNFSGCRECHIQPDWLLIYKIEKSNIYFIRTGTHSDLFR